MSTVSTTDFAATNITSRHRQLVGAFFIIGWNIVWTSLILLFIKHVLRIPLRMSEADLSIGDAAIYGVSLVKASGLFAASYVLF